MDLLGLDGQLLRHGIQREVYACEMAADSRAQLKSGVVERSVKRPGVSEISEAALNRWVRPRFERVGLQESKRDSIRQRLLGGDD